MIIDKETDFAYFSKQLLEKGFESEFRLIASILDKHKVNYNLLEGTVDIWCRDYMPI
jgi:agmatine deiminase